MARRSVFLLLLAIAAAKADPAIDTVVRASLKATGTPGAAVAVVRGGKVEHIAGYGVRAAGSHEAVTAETIFGIGSVTKAFTTTLIAMLADDGKLSWDDRVQRHLPYFRLADPLAAQTATLRDLATHRTGLGSHDLLWQSAPWSLEESIRRIGLVDLTYPFRAEYHYQNLMYNTAGYAAAAAGGAPWQELVRSRIFEPLGMTRSRFTASEAQAMPDHASPHTRDGKGMRWYPDDLQIRPAGSIKTCVKDLARWMAFHLSDGSFEGKHLLSERRMHELHTPHIVVPGEGERIVTYALGWRVSDLGERRTWTHGGSVPGFRAQIALVPSERLGVVVLINSESWAADAAANGILDRLLGLRARDWNAEMAARERRTAESRQRRLTEREKQRHKDTRPSRDLAAYSGLYQHPGYGTVRISAEADGLALGWSSFRPRLKHFHFDTFDLTGEPSLAGEQLTFSLAADGGVSRLRFLAMDFERTAPRLDYEKLAAKIVDALKLRGDERVVALFDPSVFAGLMSPLKSRIRSLSAVRVEEAGNPGATDVLLMLPLAGGNARLQAIPAWLDKGGARRAIHFHWADGTRRADGLAGEHSAEFDALYQDALDVDYRMMAARQQRAIEILRSGTARVRTPAGTDFMFRVGARPFNQQLGDASAAAMRSARIRVDREIELPPGVLRVAPVEESASGVIVIPEARFGETVAKKIALQIDNGRITRIRAEAGQQAVEAALAAGGDAGMKFREFGLGFNPKLMPAAGSSIMPYYGYGAGVIRLSLGDNEELGGNVRGSFARWFFFADATVHVDGKYLVREGRLE